MGTSAMYTEGNLTGTSHPSDKRLVVTSLLMPMTSQTTCHNSGLQYQTRASACGVSLKSSIKMLIGSIIVVPPLYEWRHHAWNVDCSMSIVHVHT